MNILDLYKNLLEYPYGTNFYREILNFYKSNDMENEAAGFADLLITKFSELPDDNNPDNNIK